MGKLDNISCKFYTTLVTLITFCLLIFLTPAISANLLTGAESSRGHSIWLPVELSAGWEHNCMIIGKFQLPLDSELSPFSADRTVVACWGDNSKGELGDGTYNDSPIPKLVKLNERELLEGIVQISASRYYTCGLHRDGTVYCWGWNEGGKLGDGSYDGFDAFKGIISIMGDGNSSAMDFMFKQVVNSIPYPIKKTSAYPVMVRKRSGELLSGVKQISAGSWHACAVLNDGTVWCWGQNFDGALGNGKRIDNFAKNVKVGPMGPDLSSVDWEYLFAPYAVQVVRNDGKPLDNVVLVRGGSSDHTCALLKDGTVWCWAWNGESDGELGIDDTTLDFSEVARGPVLDETGKPLRDVIDIAIGGDHTCVLLKDTTVKCWGWNPKGQLGTGDTESRAVATTVYTRDGKPLSGVRRIFSERGNHTCVLRDDGLYCWGDNSYKQLGSSEADNSEYSPYPVKVDVFNLDGTVRILDVAVGGGGRNPTTTSPVNYRGDHTCVLIFNEKTGSVDVLCWGSNSKGQVGTAGQEVVGKPQKVNVLPVLNSLNSKGDS